jgi:hypothetical protein
VNRYREDNRCKQKDRHNALPYRCDPIVPSRAPTANEIKKNVAMAVPNMKLEPYA